MVVEESENEDNVQVQAGMATNLRVGIEEHRCGSEDMAAQYYADKPIVTAEDEKFNGTYLCESLRTHAVEALKYLEVGDILLLRRQATAALDFLEMIDNWTVR
ncbi:hypothetical protein PG995_011634 [Apiospora arundinis]